jgi:acyl carrier protein
MPKPDSSVIDFVAEFTGTAASRLSPASTLYGDLGIDGADGWDLMEAFGEKFDVDLSGFRAERHFGPEGVPISAPFRWLWWLVSFPFRPRRTPEERAGLSAIHVSALITAARSGKWTL